MKKIYKLAIAVLWIIPMIIILPSKIYAENDVTDYTISSGNSIFSQDPIDVLDSYYRLSNKKSSDRVQKTDLDTVSSSACTEPIFNDHRFTITRTLCNIKGNLWDYLQYITFIGLAVATILLIWNGFKLVTSTDREKQMTDFKKHLIYIIIWVILLIGFYYVIDVFVRVVNVITE